MSFSVKKIRVQKRDLGLLRAGDCWDGSGSCFVCYTWYDRRPDFPG